MPKPSTEWSDTLLVAGAGAAVLGLGYYFFSGSSAQQEAHKQLGKAEGKVCPSSFVKSPAEG